MSNDDSVSATASGTGSAIKEAEPHNDPKIGGKDKLEELCVNTIRFLSIDGVEKAKTGHPSAPIRFSKVPTSPPTPSRISVKTTIELGYANRTLLIFSVDASISPRAIASASPAASISRLPCGATNDHLPSAAGACVPRANVREFRENKSIFIN